MNEIRTNDPANSTFEVTSTSNRTASVTPIELRRPTEMTRLFFQPVLVENSKEPSNSVEGKLIYERKGKNDDSFPSQHGAGFFSKGNVKRGDALEISLSSSETKSLYLGLRDLYQIHEDGEGIPYGTTSFVKIDNASRTLLSLLREDASSARMIADKDTFALVKELLKLLTQGTSPESLNSIFDELENGNMARLSTSLNFEMLERAKSEIESNMENSSEEYWQTSILETYPWIISQLFSTPCVLFDSKAYVGGKSIKNKHGNVVDFLYQNKMTKNVALVEIKTPCTKLLGRQYRGRSFTISYELSGAINQVLSYRQSLIAESSSLRVDSSDAFEAFSPNCIVIAGNTCEFDKLDASKRRDAIGSFENFRNALNGITVVTYDELLQKVADLLILLGRSIDDGEEPTHETDSSTYSDFEDDIPF